MAPMPVLAAMLMLVMSKLFDLSALSYQENICLAVIVIELIIVGIPAVFYIKLRHKKLAGRLRFNLFGIEKFVITIIATVTLISGDLLIKLFMNRLGLLSSNYTVYDSFLQGYNPGILYSIFTLAIIPAIVEELLFRSVLCAEYESSGVATAVIASSMLYAMFGSSFAMFPLYFFAGLIFAFVLYATDSLFCAMICHVIYNCFELIAAEPLWNIITKPQSLSFLTFAAVALFLVCIICFFGEAEHIYSGYAYSNKPSDYIDQESEHRSSAIDALLAPPFLAVIILFVLAATKLV